MAKFFNIFYDIRKGEWYSAGLMFSLHFLLMVSLYFLKPARDSLFLIEVGPRQLPIVYILLALVAIPVAQLLSRVIQRTEVKKVLMGTLLILISNLLIIRWLLEFDAGWIYLLFYVWVGIFGILVISQFWLLANGIFDAAQSKRLFAFLNLGAILGAIAGSQISSLLISEAGLITKDLLFICILMLIGCMVIIYFVYTSDNEIPDITGESELPEKESAGDVFRTVYKSRYQMMIAGIIGFTMLVSTLVDYQFKTVAAASYPDTASLTSFMGIFYGGLSFASLLIQVLLSSQIIRKMGLGGAILTRPAGLLVGAVLMAIEPVLVSAVFLRGYDGATRYSIDKTGLELLYLPLSQRVKRRTKVFIDIFVDRFFRGLAGFLLLIFIYLLDFSIRQITFFVIGVTVCWIAVGYMAKRAYVHKFRSSLRKRYIRKDNIALDLDESSVYITIKEALESDEESQVLYALNLLKGVDASKVSDQLRKLLNHKRAEIRLRALTLLQNVKDVHHIDDALKLLKDDNPEVRLEAIYYLCQHSDDDPSHVIRSYLMEEDKKVKSAALGCVSKHAGQQPELVDDKFLQELIGQDNEEGIVIRAQIAQSMGYIEDKDRAFTYLKQLLDDEEPVVVREAIKGIRKQGNERFIPLLFDKLNDSRYTLEIRETLASYGKEYLELYKQKFFDESFSYSTRRKIPGIFSKVRCQESINYLIVMLEVTNPELRYHVIKSLNKLRKRNGDYNFSEGLIRNVLIEETKGYYKLLSIKLVQRKDIPNNILITAIDEKMDQALERIFRLAGLLYNSKDMLGSYRALRSSRKEIRAASIEFLDNILSLVDKKYIFPIVDDLEETVRLEKGQELFNLKVNDYESGLKELLEGEDIWLKACAIFSISATCPESLQQKVVEYSNHDHPLLSETANYVIERMNK